MYVPCSQGISVRSNFVRVFLALKSFLSESVLWACFFLWGWGGWEWGGYGPSKNISLISSRSFIKGWRKPENPGKTTWPSVSSLWKWSYERVRCSQESILLESFCECDSCSQESILLESFLRVCSLLSRVNPVWIIFVSVLLALKGQSC